MRTLSTILFALAVTALAPACDKTNHVPDESHDAAPNTTADDPTTDPAQDSEIPFPTRDLACDASGEKVVEEWLRTYLNWAERVLSTPDDQELVTLEEPPATDGPADADPMLIYVGPDETLVKQVPVTDDQLAEKHLDKLNQSKREADILGIEWSNPGVAVSFAKETPWSRVVSTFATLQALDTGPIYLGFHLPRPDELGAPDPALMKAVSDHYSLTATEVHPRHASSTAGCDQMVDLYKAFPTMRYETRLKILPEGLGKAWVACECEPDIEWLVGVMHTTSGYPITLAPIELGSGQTVSHRADATWQDAHSSVLDASGPIELAIAE